MKKNIKLTLFASTCLLSFMTCFALKKDYVDRFITKGVKAYYEEGTQNIEVIYLNNEYDNHEGYVVSNIENYDEYYKVTYTNNEDVVVILDENDFGTPISMLNKDYVNAAKRLCLKSH